MKRIYKSREDKVLDGVCGGLAKYFNVDAVIIRLIWVLAAIFLGQIFWGVIFYLIAMAIMPTEPRNIEVPHSSSSRKKRKEESSKESQQVAAAQGEPSSVELQENNIVGSDDSRASDNTSIDGISAGEGDSDWGENNSSDSTLDSDNTSFEPSQQLNSKSEKSTTNTTLILGIGLVAFGAMLLLDRFTFEILNFNMRHMFHYLQTYFWPTILIGIGIFLITRRKS